MNDIVMILALGFAAGVLGGLAGVGGAMLILPGLHFVLDRAGTSSEVHHLYMAAAMVTNIFVALPAAIQHRRVGVVRRDLVPTLLVSSIVFMLVGVLASNVLRGDALRLALAAFITAYCMFNLWRVFRKTPDPAAGSGTPSKAALWSYGGATGLMGGLLGLGGGGLLVPILQILGRVGLRESIATSSSVIWIAAIFGATLKVATIGSHGFDVWDVLRLAAWLAPTAVVGSVLGAKLTHALPLTAVRLAITAILAVAALKLAGAF